MKDGAKVRLFAGICKLLPDYLTISCCSLVFGASGRKADDNILCIQSAVIQALFYTIGSFIIISTGIQILKIEHFNYS